MARDNFKRPNPTPILARVERKAPTDYLALAAAQLCEPSANPQVPEAWESSNQYINCCRRPIKKYPRVYISAPELAQIIEEYDRSGIPRDRLRSAIILVDAKLASNEASGKSNSSVCVFSWLCGWVRQQLLETLIKEKRLQRVSTF